MNDISVGAVGAAIIAGLVSLLGLIIGKEQKVSEFRQAWINDLRKCLVDYLVNINAISDAVRLKKAGKAIDDAALLVNYKLLNEANHGIVLRINDGESSSKRLRDSMEEFEALSKSNSTLTPKQISDAEKTYLAAAKELLKFEWKRVKRGENLFVRTKRIVIVAIAAMLVLLAYFWTTGERQETSKIKPPLQLVRTGLG